MPAITVKMQGGFGNQVMQWLWAKGYAERHGFDFLCEPWLGSTVFDLDDKQPWSGATDLPGRSSETLVDGEGDVRLEGYGQDQRSVTYTRKQARAWLQISPKAMSLIPKSWVTTWLNDQGLVAHRRVGDYVGYGYPIVSKESYFRAAKKFALPGALQMVSDEYMRLVPSVPAEFSFLPDFLRLLNAKYLLRGDSTFSWVAGLLGHAKVFSPVVGHLGAGEHDVEFVEGNWPRISHQPCCTDMHVPER